MMLMMMMMMMMMMVMTRDCCFYCYHYCCCYHYRHYQLPLLVLLPLVRLPCKNRVRAARIILDKGGQGCDKVETPRGSTKTTRTNCSQDKSKTKPFKSAAYKISLFHLKPLKPNTKGTVTTAAARRVLGSLRPCRDRQKPMPWQLDDLAGWRRLGD